MTALVAGELARLLSRRLTRVIALLALLGIVLAGILTFVNTSDLDQNSQAARAAAAQRNFEECVDANVPVGPDAGPNQPPLSSDQRRRLCAQAADSYRVGQDDRFQVRDVKGVFQGTSAPLVMVAWVLGASSMGADWQSRTITTLLTWEPRRMRVLLAKALAAATVAFVFTLLAQALLGGTLLPSALLHGDTSGTGGEWFRSVVGVVLRGGLLAAVGATLGMAVATLGRSTAAALGAGFVYVVVVENVVGSVIAGWRRWLLLGNSIVLISGIDQGGSDDISGRSVVGAGIYLTVVAAALFLVATLVFNRRDVP